MQQWNRPRSSTKQTDRQFLVGRGVYSLASAKATVADRKFGFKLYRPDEAKAHGACRSARPSVRSGPKIAILPLMLAKTLRLAGAVTFGALNLTASQYQSFKVAVYVAPMIQKMKDPEWLKANWAVVENSLKVDKVYLEVHRDLIIVDAETLRQAKAFFTAKGIAVAGGIATVKNESKLFETFDYTNPDDRAKIKEIVTATAKAFDEFILDDFFFTSSKSASAIAQKATAHGTDFRLELMEEASRDLVLDLPGASTRRSGSSSNTQLV